MRKKAMGNVALVVLAAFAVLIALTLLSGFQYNTVRSGSMAPAINVGDVVVTAPVDAGDIKVGDVISFHSPNGGVLICHRVISVDRTAGFVQTKGDANEDPDWFTVPYSKVTGRVVADVPLLGFVLSFLTSMYGIGVTVMWAMIFLLCDDVLKRSRKDGEGQQSKGGAT
jgi:signal peptidase